MIYKKWLWWKTICWSIVNHTFVAVNFQVLHIHFCNNQVIDLLQIWVIYVTIKGNGMEFPLIKWSLMIMTLYEGSINTMLTSSDTHSPYMGAGLCVIKTATSVLSWCTWNSFWEVQIWYPQFSMGSFKRTEAVLSWTHPYRRTRIFCNMTFLWFWTLGNLRAGNVREFYMSIKIGTYENPCLL